MSSTDVPLTITPATLPEGICFSSEQERLNYFAKMLSGRIDGQFNGVNFGSSTPAVADRDKPWIRTISGTSASDRTYVWFDTVGAWVSKHGLVPGVCALYTGSIGSIDTFDGGESATVGDATGPMWEVVTDAAGRFFVHPGTTANGTSITVAGTGGADEITIAQANLPAIQIDIPIPKEQTSATDTGQGLIATGNSGNEPSDATTLQSEELGDGDAITILPPYYGAYLIRRTARIYYRV